MKISPRRNFSCIAYALSAIALAAPVQAQETDNGAAEAEAWAPDRLPDGQPDIQGFWMAAGVSSVSLAEPAPPPPEDALAEGPRGLFGEDQPEFGASEFDAVFRTGPGAYGPDFTSPIIDPPDGKLPLRPWAEERFRQNRQRHRDPRGDAGFVDSMTRCLPSGVPRLMYATPYNGVQLIQTSNHLVVYQEFNHQYRVIPLDGRPHIGENIKLWNGDARGRWEDGTLVIDTANLNGKTWFDQTGTFHTDAMQVQERLTIVDPDTIAVEVTIDDPEAYTRPWTFAYTLNRIADPDYEIFEFACHESNRGLPAILGN